MVSEPVEVSVIIPIRNVEATLESQLRALNRQRTDRTWEAIIVDNGSTDRTNEIAKAHLDLLPRSQLIFDDDGSGVGYARDRGVEHSSGSKLVFCDGDDEVTPGWLEAMASALEENQLVGGRLDRRPLNDPRRVVPGTELLTSLPMYCGFRPYASGASLGIVRQLYDALEGFRDDLLSVEDADLALRAYKLGVEPVFCEQAVVYYRDRPTAGQTFRQYYSYGRYDPEMYRHHKHSGLPRRGPIDVASFWVRTVSIGWRGMRSLPHRVQFVRLVGRGLGRLSGSVRHRVIYL